MNNLDKLLQLNKTTFNVKDWIKIFATNDLYLIRSYFNKIKKKWILIQPKNGIWILPNFNKLELWSKLMNKCYISLETVLSLNSIIFQSYENTITCLSNKDTQYSFWNYIFTYKRISNSILDNNDWIDFINDWNIKIASKERAICDFIHIYWKIEFENINKRNISLSKIKGISNIYPKKTILKINKLINDIK